jgi:hypothetical protein
MVTKPTGIGPESRRPVGTPDQFQEPACHEGQRLPLHFTGHMGTAQTQGLGSSHDRLAFTISELQEGGDPL